MELTEEIKTKIDALTYAQLLRQWRFAPLGDPMFQGETGKYWGTRLSELRDADPEGAVLASKAIGWENHF